MKNDHNLKQVFPDFSFYNDIARTERVHPAIIVNAPSPSTYFNKEGLLKVSQPNKPVIEYDAVGNCLGLRSEPFSSNLIIDSEFRTFAVSGNNVWHSAQGVLLNTSTQLAPDGVSTAKVLNPNRDNGQAIWYYSPDTPTFNTCYGFSFFVKPNVQNLVNIVAQSANSELLASCVVRLEGNGVVVSETYNQSKFFGRTIVEKVGSLGWYRVGVTFQVNKSGDTSVGLRVGISTSANANSLFLWGAQLEPYYGMTSYIATNGSAVSRSTMSLSMTTGEFQKLVDGNNFTIYTCSEIRDTITSNHIHPGASLYTGANYRCRTLMRANDITDTSQARFMLSGRTNNSTVTDNLNLSSVTPTAEVYKLKDITLAFTSRQTGNMYAAAFGKVVMQFPGVGNIGVSASTEICFGGYRPSIDNRNTNSLGDSVANGYFKRIGIAPVTVSPRILRAMTDVNISEEQYSALAMGETIA